MANQPTIWATRQSKHLYYAKKLWKFFWIGSGIFFLYLIILSFFLPSFESLENPNSRLASTIYANDGSIMGTFFEENRVNVKYEDISPFVIKAAIATEDERFYGHSGIDARALGRVVGKTILGGDESGGGGSTITQQFAKLLLGRPGTKGMWFPMKFVTLVNTKLKEWLTAIKLERCYTKEEIITMYLNQFDYLYGAFGIRSAAKTYFGKQPKDLSIQEAAILVGMFKNPSMFNPMRFAERAKGRRNQVLYQMKINGYLGQDDKKAKAVYDSLCALPVDVSKFKRLDHNEGQAPHFREYLRQWVKEKLKDIKKSNGEPYDIYKDGLKIYSTLDPIMQKHAEASVYEHLKEHQKKFFEHWKGSDPWTMRPTSDTQVPVDVRLSKLNDLLYSSDRWQAARESLAPTTESNDLREVDVDRMKRIEDLESEKSGSGKEKINSWESTGFITKELADKYKKVMGSSDWAKIKKEREAMLAYFKTPVQMKVFSYEPSGETDTLMSPYDSVRYHRMILQTGTIAIDPRNGQVKAWVGGAGFRYFKYDHVNRHTRRQVGSTIKPLLYGLSYDIRGFGPCYPAPDMRNCISPGDGNFGMSAPWCPDNAGSGYSGSMVALKDGLRHSLNSVSAYLMKDMNSTQPFRDFLSKVGIDTANVPPQPSICLGSADISVFEMAGAYSIFANNGVFVEPMFVTRIEDKNGNVILDLESEQKQRQALGAQAAYAMAWTLNYVLGDKAGFEGIKSKMGGKTGTTQDQSDGWYMGISPNICVGVWVGCDDRFLRFRSMTYGQGARMARPIYQKFMRKIEGDQQLKFEIFDDFTKPDPFDIELNCGAYSVPDASFLGNDGEGGEWEEY